jgi:peptidyl-prolyl cis-trans isomerase SurA
MKKRFCVLILLSTWLAYGQNLLDKIVAIVDDDIILYSEVTQSAYLMAMQLGIDPQKAPDRFQKLEQQTLENLINQKLLLIQAEKDTIEANEREVDNYLEQQMASVIQQLGGEDKVEEYFGTTMSRIRRNYREDIEKNLRIQTVQQQKFANVKVTRREVEEFFKTHRDSIGKRNRWI